MGTQSFFSILAKEPKSYFREYIFLLFTGMAYLNCQKRYFIPSR